MNRTRTPLVDSDVTAVVTAVLAAVVAASLTWWWSMHDADGTASPPQRSVAVSPLEASGPPTGDPDLPGFATADPVPGTVARVAGPFDDRFVLHDVRLGRSAVTGELEVTSDVSDILELQVVVAFYDSTGTRTGQERYTYHLDEGSDPQARPTRPGHAFAVTIPPAIREGVTSAAVGVPVLVNE